MTFSIRQLTCKFGDYEEIKKKEIKSKNNLSLWKFMWKYVTGKRFKF